MNVNASKMFVKLAQETKGPFSKIAANSIEVVGVVPSVLEANLEAAKYGVKYKPGEGHGFWCAVVDGGSGRGNKTERIVARAFSHDKGDSLLQAIYAEVKAEAAG